MRRIDSAQFDHVAVLRGDVKREPVTLAVGMRRGGPDFNPLPSARCRPGPMTVKRHQSGDAVRFVKELYTPTDS